MNTNTIDLNDRIELFLKLLGEMYAEHFRINKFQWEPPVFIRQTGPKYIRIVLTERGTNSVYCFIDRSNGDILKSDGWKKPAKGARGSIYNPNCDVGVKATVYGSGLYLR